MLWAHALQTRASEVICKGASFLLLCEFKILPICSGVFAMPVSALKLLFNRL